MQKKTYLALLLFSSAASNVAHAQIANEQPLLRKDLPDLPGKEGLVEKVVLAPGEVVRPHRHDADVFVYVLQGSMTTQVKGGELKTIRAGETYYEAPTDKHTLSRNASATEPATLLVFFVKEKGAPQTRPLEKAHGEH